MTVTAATNTKTYDGNTGAVAIPAVTSGMIFAGDTANFSETYDNRNAGTGKTLTASGTVNDGNGGNNYAYTFGTSTTGAINTAALTVTANAATKTYDGLAWSGGNGAAYSGLVNGETAAVLGGALAYGGTSQGAINVGNYLITPSGLTSGNYAISFADGALTVNKANLAVAAKAAIRAYNAQAYSGGNGVSYSGFVNGETAAVLGGALAYGGSSQGAINVGNYVITPGGLTSGNYAIAFNDGTLTIRGTPTVPGAPVDGYTGASASGNPGGSAVAIAGGSTSASSGAAFLTVDSGENAAGGNVQLASADNAQGAASSSARSASSGNTKGESGDTAISDEEAAADSFATEYALVTRGCGQRLPSGLSC